MIGYGTYNVKTSRTIEIALECGYRLIDSARNYGTEVISGKAIAAFLAANPSVSRKDITYVTKVPCLGYDATVSNIKDSFDKIRNEIGHIDLALVHFPAQDAHTRLETYRALQEAVDLGYVKNLGVSNFGVKALAQLLEWPGLTHKPIANQIEINPWYQQNDVVQLCHREGIVVQVYSPLIGGQKDNDPQLLSLCTKYGATTAQVLLSWNLRRNTLPIIKSSNAERIKSNFDLGKFELTPDEVESLGDKTTKVATCGHRTEIF